MLPRSERPHGCAQQENTTGDGAAAYTYDDAGRLVSATKSGVTAAYKINSLGERVRKTVGSANTYFAYDHNGWVLIEADRGENASLEALVNKLLHAIDLNRVKQLTLNDPSVEIELSIIVHLSESAPSMFLSSHQVKCLADIGAEIDVDIYPG